MLQELGKEQLAARVKAIKWSPSALARKAQVAATTVARGAQRIRTHNEIVEALESEEIAILRHLAMLHPQVAMEAATLALCPVARGNALAAAAERAPEAGAPA